MLDTKTTMALTLKLMEMGIDNTADYINSHSEEELLRLLDEQSGSPLVITKSGDSVGTASATISSWCIAHKMSEEDFNQQVIIAGDIECSYMFYRCASFNQPVVIPEGVEDTGHMFEYCTSFNNPIVIPDGVLSCNYMFRGCTSFNQPVTLPESVMYCKNMFADCSSFNSLVKAPKHLQDRLKVPDGAKVEWY